MLMNPGHNRAYFTNARELALSELALAMGEGCSARFDELAGVTYAVFDAEALKAGDVGRIARLSMVYAIFEREGDMLRPVDLGHYAYLDPKLSSLMKYQGKTNELFTRFLINCAAFSAIGGTGKLLDPVAGKGTTLFEGLVLGLNVCGMEVGGKAALEGCRCLKRFLEDERLKHTASSIKQSGEGRAFAAERYSIEIFRTREEEKRGERRTFEMVTASSEFADKVFKRNSFDIIAGDLPYGVQHSSVTNEKQTKQTRDPSELLRVCLPAWRSVLRTGGAMALSWNTNVLSRKRLSGLIADAGFEVLSGGAYDRLAHRVDAAIARDVIVALKTE